MRTFGPLDRAASWCERAQKAQAEDLRQLKAQEAVLAEREAPRHGFQVALDMCREDKLCARERAAEEDLSRQPEAVAFLRWPMVVRLPASGSRPGSRSAEPHALIRVLVH